LSLAGTSISPYSSLPESSSPSDEDEDEEDPDSDSEEDPKIFLFSWY